LKEDEAPLVVEMEESNNKTTQRIRVVKKRIFGCEGGIVIAAG